MLSVPEPFTASSGPCLTLPVDRPYVPSALGSKLANVTPDGNIASFVSACDRAFGRTIATAYDLADALGTLMLAITVLPSHALT